MPEKSRIIRVFLSSTFRDFAEERDLLVRKVFPELRRLCRDRQVELVEVDLRWGITEEEAQQGKVLPICLGEVDRARPYFMGFIGDRYGWVPEGNQYPAGIVEREPWLKEHAGGKSVTELEMLHGVLNNPEMAGRAFFYFRDSNYSRSKGGDYLSEDTASAAKLEALKNRIRASKFPVVEDYADPQALADQVRADLLALIEEEYPADEVPDDLTLERMRHEAYSQARRGLYIGGEPYFVQLDAAMSAEAPRPVLISGEAGLGKSALIASWLQGWRAKHPKTPVILHHLNATAEADDPMHLVRRLGEEAALITGRPYEAAKSKDEILEQLPGILADLSGHAEREGLSVLIVLDGLERCGATFEDLRWFPKYVPPRIHLLASCSDGPAQAHLQNFPLDWTRIALKPLSKAQSRDFIERYLKNFTKSLVEDQAARILAHPLSGRPLWLITLLEELRLFGVHEELEANLETLLSDPLGKAEGEAPTIDDLYEHVLARIEKDIDEDYEVAAFKALWASYDGLARSELLELTGMPPAKWAEIQNALDENLFESGGKITFANDFIRKAVENRHLPTEEDKRAAHCWLGEWFEGREVTLDVAQERVHQWREAGDKERLRACLLEEAVFEELYKHDKYALLKQWLWLGEDIETAYRKATECWAKFNHGDDFEKIFIYEILAGFLQLAGSYSNYVEALLSDSICLSKRHYGEKNEHSVKLIYGLAQLFYHRRDDGFGEAIKLFELLHFMMKESLGRNHPDTIKVEINVGELLWNFGDFSRSEKVATESIRFSLKNGNLESQKNLRRAYLLMSLCSKKKNNHNDAIYYLKGAHDISTALFGEKSFEFATTGMRLGLEMGDEKSLNMCFKSISLMSILMGENHGFTKNATHNFIQKFGMYELARAWIIAGEVVKCKYWIQEAIDRRGDDKERAILDLDFLPIKNFIKSL
jgi:nephrocystin-3